MTGDGLADDLVAARPRVVAALAARFCDLDLAEDGFADACAKALERFSDDERPANLAGWLHVVAKRKIVDRLRRDARQARSLSARADLEEEMAMPEVELLDEPVPDERLRLIFICCHPSIAANARVALTLRVVCGIPTEDIARAFLVEEPAMYQRLTRAKAKIAKAGIPFETPPRDLWADRLGAVLATLEIGYALAYQDAAATSAAAELGPEVLRLTNMLAELIPDDPEVLGLAALVALAESRRGARVDGAGMMIPLSEQDVSLWRQPLIDHAVRLMDRAAEQGRSGPLQIMAAIHLTHARRRAEGRVDWAVIAELYGWLHALRPTATVAVNRAVAVGRANGATAGLAMLDALDASRLSGYRPFHAARGHFLMQTGQRSDAREAYRRALDLAPPDAERRFLNTRLAALD